jgi:hypothetical protein
MYSILTPTDLFKKLRVGGFQDGQIRGPLEPKAKNGHEKLVFQPTTWTIRLHDPLHFADDPCIKSTLHYAYCAYLWNSILSQKRWSRFHFYATLDYLVDHESDP